MDYDGRAEEDIHEKIATRFAPFPPPRRRITRERMPPLSRHRLARLYVPGSLVFRGVSASFFSLPMLPIARERYRSARASHFCSLSLPRVSRSCCMIHTQHIYIYICTHSYAHIHAAHTSCEETIHARPAFHSRKFTYTYLVGYPYHPFPQRGFVPRSIWGLVPQGRTRRRR